jgi:hypothetical protein
MPRSCNPSPVALRPGFPRACPRVLPRLRGGCLGVTYPLQEGIRGFLHPSSKDFRSVFRPQLLPGVPVTDEVPSADFGCPFPPSIPPRLRPQPPPRDGYPRACPGLYLPLRGGSPRVTAPFRDASGGVRHPLPGTLRPAFQPQRLPGMPETHDAPNSGFGSPLQPIAAKVPIPRPTAVGSFTRPTADAWPTTTPSTCARSSARFGTLTPHRRGFAGLAVLQPGASSDRFPIRPPSPPQSPPLLQPARPPSIPAFARTSGPLRIHPRGSADSRESGADPNVPQRTNTPDAPEVQTLLQPGEAQPVEYQS